MFTTDEGLVRLNLWSKMYIVELLTNLEELDTEQLSPVETGEDIRIMFDKNCPNIACSESECSNNAYYLLAPCNGKEPKARCFQHKIPDELAMFTRATIVVANRDGFSLGYLATPPPVQPCEVMIKNFKHLHKLLLKATDTITKSALKQ